VVIEAVGSGKSSFGSALLNILKNNLEVLIYMDMLHVDQKKNELIIIQIEGISD
jgi:uridine kinase